ncbi:competence protein ComEC [Formosa sp. Hel1_31_208]|nr:competence protein ComEC [Formosa sp. Hel1_31_208]
MVTLALFCLTFTRAKYRLNKTIWFGGCVYFTMISIGALTYTFHDQKNFSNHYTLFNAVSSAEPIALTFKIKERLKPSIYHDKYVIELLQLKKQKTTGLLLLNIERDSLLAPLKIDDVFITYSNLEAIKTPLNPNQFDYKAYLERLYIYQQLFLNHNSILKLNSKKRTVFGYAEVLRQTINQKLNHYNFHSKELMIINALLLGQRQDMDRDTYKTYADAGAIHILAVSGLHVGIILLLLNYLLKPIAHFKRGKVIKVTLILVLLWSFAIIAGLSASVTRAVTMFSILAIAMHLKRPTNIYNTLAISVFIVLLFKPMFLFDVGFQLSYVAVIAIVSIQPLLFKLWHPKWKITTYFWQVLTVTFAAQLGVVPLSLYYFHQFPGLFFVSNLAIIPFLGFILGFGILVIVLALLDSLPEVLAHGYSSIIRLMNSIVSWVSQKEQFIFQDISFNSAQVITFYLSLITIVSWYQKRTFRRMVVMLISIILLQVVYIYSAYKHANNTFTVFHKSRHSVIGIKTNSQLQINHNMANLNIQNSGLIEDYSVGNFINSIKSDSLKSVYQFQNKILLIIDSLGVYNVKMFQPEYVLLRNSPRIHLNRMIDSIQPQLIIADGSNYKSYIKRWAVTCSKRKIPFHYTGEKGAFIIN